MKSIAALFAALTLFLPFAAAANEQINTFDVEIAVEKDGDVVVTETINVTAEGYRINHGIFRELPRFYTRDGAKYPYQYAIRRIERDGALEPYTVNREGNAVSIRIGDADIYVDRGAHDYVIEYEVKNQVRYFEDYDEIYWNVTGNYWDFPIASARASIHLPDGARIVQTSGYTGALGEAGKDFSGIALGDSYVFATNRMLMSGEGLTVAVGFEKGAVDPPSAEDRNAEWWLRNRASVFLCLAMAGIALYYMRSFVRVGRDPVKGPVFPRYEPPKGVTPAGVHRVYHRGFVGYQALIATLLDLAIKGRIKIDASKKSKTKLTLQEGGAPASPPAEELLQGIFSGRDEFTLGEKYDSQFTLANAFFQIKVGREYGSAFFQWNSGYTVLAGILSIATIVITVILSVELTVWHFLGFLVLIAGFFAFAYFIPAPTLRGQETRTEIEGFRLYMKTAEKIYLDAVKPGSGQPPPMTVERYERFLPYAVALGVEDPWTRHFERLMPEEAARYQPRWVSSGGRASSLHGLNRSLMSSMSSGVKSSLPQSSSSSGSGGGGSSGGGGGGGGGGGW